ncbi:MAG: hypothetical protein OXG43_02775 [Chloroflexi bacterium]|nr:hypothetical protein [Chloroflexota bacterium]
MRHPESPPAWTPLTTGEGGTVTALAAGPPGADRQVVVAGTLSGLFVGREYGQAWEKLSALGNRYVQAAAISPAFESDATLIVGTAGSGAFLSVDGGASWREQEFWGRRPDVTALVFSPTFANDGMILAGTSQDGVYVTTNRGRTWNAANLGLADLSVNALAAHLGPAGNGLLFAGTSTGLYQWAAEARQWFAVAGYPAGNPVQAIVVAPTPGDSALFVGTEGAGLWRSIDGDALHRLETIDADSSVNAIAVSADFSADATLMIATTQRGLMRSHDRGDSWQPLAGAADANSVLALTSCASPDGQVWLAGLHERGVLRSANGGGSWEPSNVGLSSRPVLALALSPRFASDGTLLVGTAAEGVLRSTDGGATWSRASDGLEAPSVTSLTFSRTFPADRRVWAIAGASLVESLDGGQTWAPVAGLPGDVVPLSLASACDAQAGHAVAVGGAAGALALSRDGGESWTRSAEHFGGANVVTVAFSPNYALDATLLAATTGDGMIAVYRSTDRGSAWSQILEHAGDGWASLAIPPTYGPGDDFIAVATGREVITPAGRRVPSWRATRPTEARLSVLAVVASAHFATNNTLYAATSRGVFRSSDRGRIWRRLSAGMGAPPVTALTLASDEAAKDVLVAGTLDGTVWRLRDAAAAQD